MNNPVISEFTRENIVDRMDKLEEQLLEARDQEEDKRDKTREFELMYAKFMAGLRLSTGMRLY